VGIITLSRTSIAALQPDLPLARAHGLRQNHNEQHYTPLGNENPSSFSADFHRQNGCTHRIKRKSGRFDHAA
jgi:hypothetical protein